MGSVNARDLARQTAAILDEVERTRRPILVFRRGKPVAALVAIDEDGLEDCALANAPELAASFHRADQDARAGRMRPAADVFAELRAQAPTDQTR